MDMHCFVITWISLSLLIFSAESNISKINEGIAAYSKRDYATAESLLQVWFDIETPDAKILSFLIASCIAQQKYDVALTHIRHAVERIGWNSWLVITGEHVVFHELHRLWVDCEKHDEDCAQFAYYLCKSAYHSQQFEIAIEWCSFTWKSYGERARLVLPVLAQAHMDTGELSQAKQAILEWKARAHHSYDREIIFETNTKKR